MKPDRTTSPDHYSRHWLRALWAVAFACLSLLGTSQLVLAADTEPKAAAVEIPIDGPIGPAISSFVTQEITAANKHRAPVIILRLDTPGGLSSAMRDIVKAVLASPVPVVGYVGPSGARAASAGTYILYATHIAAMAPATNLGAATPINIAGGDDTPDVVPARAPSHNTPPANDNSRENIEKTASESAEPSDKQTDQPSQDDQSDSTLDLANSATERRKAVNDAVAYIRSLAEQRGRNADWAEAAVRTAASLSATEARNKHVIDLIADNPADLLQQIDGRTVSMPAGDITLHTQGLAIETHSPDWRTQFLALVTDPTVAYLLFMVGIVGLVAEAFNPGVALPGIVGGISLVTALFAFQVLPVDYSGAALILLGLALFVAEAFVPSFGTLGLGGIAAFVFGSIMLMDDNSAAYGVSLAVIVGIALAAAALLALLVWMFARSRKAHIETGHQGLIGRPCIALKDFEREGRVWLHGESWLAVCNTPVARHQRLVVTDAQGLTVYVRPDDDRSAVPIGEPPTRS